MQTASACYGVALLVLLPLIALWFLLDDPTSLASNRALFSSCWFLYNYFGRNFVEVLLSSGSVLFRGMDAKMRRQDANFVTFAVGSILFCLPAGVYTIYHLYRLGPDAFLPLYEGSSRTLISMGIAGEIVDLVSRHRLPWDVVVHHLTEIVGGSLMIDSYVADFEPGFLLLAMTTVVGRPAMVGFIFGHVGREGSSDTLFPDCCLSEQGQRRTLFVAWVILVFTAFVQPLVYVSIYLSMFHDHLPMMGKVFLPFLALIFMSADVNASVTIWKKLHVRKVGVQPKLTPASAA